MKYTHEDFHAAFSKMHDWPILTFKALCDVAADTANAKLEKDTASDMLALLVRVQKLEAEIERMKNNGRI